MNKLNERAFGKMRWRSLFQLIREAIVLKFHSYYNFFFFHNCLLNFIQTDSKST